jgi:putative flippase GtrA
MAMRPDVAPGAAARSAPARLGALAARWVRWGAVGTLGLGLQLTTLVALIRVPGVHYLTATFMAVAGAIVHNFLWHERWTWADRPSRNLGHRLTRFARFTAITGLVSIAGNVALTATYVEYLKLPLLAANLLAVASISAVNFAAAHHLVFFGPSVARDMGGRR